MSKNKWIDIRLKTLGKTKGGLAKALGITRNASITDIINGSRSLNAKEIPALSRYLELPLSEIYSQLNIKSPSFNENPGGQFQHAGSMNSIQKQQSISTEAVYEALEFLQSLYGADKPPKEEVMKVAERMEFIANSVGSSVVDSNLAAYAYNTLKQSQ